MAYAFLQRSSADRAAGSEVVVFKDASLDVACDGYVGATTNWLPWLVRAVFSVAEGTSNGSVDGRAGSSSLNESLTAS